MNERISSISLFRETSCSLLFRVRAGKEYVLKKAKRKNINHEFLNHKTIYHCWLDSKEKLDFKIPALFLQTADKKAYLMEYIDGVNLLDMLLKNNDKAAEVFKLVGKCLHQYHRLATRRLAEKKIDITEHPAVKKLLEGPKAEQLKNYLSLFKQDSYRILLKDFTPSNILVHKNNDIYLVDFQNIYYSAPLYYDLARFIDTTKVFTLVRRPLHFLLRHRRLTRILDGFLEGYGEKLDPAHLRAMQRFHRAEHILSKLDNEKLDAMILKLIYCLIR